MISNCIALSLLEVALFPLELYKGVEIQQTDLKNTHWEADTIIIHLLAVVKPQQSAIVKADVTDVFVLLSFLSYRNNQFTDLDGITFQRSVNS
jgi:hypothetical protein